MHGMADFRSVTMADIICVPLRLDYGCMEVPWAGTLLAIFWKVSRLLIWIGLYNFCEWMMVRMAFFWWLEESKGTFGEIWRLACVWSDFLSVLGKQWSYVKWWMSRCTTLCPKIVRPFQEWFSDCTKENMLLSSLHARVVIHGLPSLDEVSLTSQGLKLPQRHLCWRVICIQ